MNKIFLFDLGGVLQKSMNINKLYERLNCKISYKEFEKYWFCDKSVIDAHKGLITDEFHIKKLLDFSGSSISINDFKKIYCELSEHLYKSTIKIINELKEKNYKVGLLSNLRLMDFNNCKIEIDKLNLNYMFLSYEIGLLKPYNSMYEYVINKCKCVPEDIVFFDDNVKNVIGAKDCGINAYLATGENIEEIFNKYVLKMHE